MSLTGTRVGHFRIGESLGRGAMGEVYAGFNEALQKDVALKALRAERRLSRRARSRFLREARILSHLDHPNICRIHDYIEGDEADLLVLELIEGSGLRAAIERGIDRGEKLRIAEQIASVLVEAHTAGVVHRDLKPGNVMLTARGQVKVLDFGLARDASETHETRGGFEQPIPHEGVVSDRTLDEELDGPPTPGTIDRLELPTGMQTADGSVVGTPSYMSPEQARGEPSTTASDMYSFGLLLQVLFTGRAPYEQGINVLSLLELAMRGESLPVEGLDADLTRLIDRLKSLAPAQRPTAVDAAARLRRIREKPRRRLRRIAVAAAVVVAVLAGVKYTIDLSRERSIARQREAQAVELLDFMLGDLRLKLEPLGKLDLLDDVGTQARAFFETLDPGRRLTDEELFSYTRMMSQIGQVRLGQGELSAAKEAFDESLAMASTLVGRDLENGSWQQDLGEAHFWIGSIHFERGELDDALARFRSYREIVEHLAAREPQSEVWQLELAYGHTNIGSVLELQGDPEGAIAEHRAALSIKQRLAEASPDDAERQTSLATTYEDLGKALRGQGQLDEAGQHLESSVAIHRRLVARAPDDLLRLESLGISLHLLGQLLGIRGDRAEARDLLREDLEIARRLAENDPANVHWQRGVAMSLGSIGELLATADPDESQASFDESTRLLLDLVERHPDRYAFMRDLAAVKIENGRACEKQLRFDRAQHETTEGRGTLMTIVKEHPDDRRARRSLAEAYVLDGRLAERKQDMERARYAWNSALVLIEPLARDSADVSLAQLWAEALLRLDRIDDATSLLARLSALKYRDPEFDQLCKTKGMAIKAPSRG